MFFVPRNIQRGSSFNFWHGSNGIVGEKAPMIYWKKFFADKGVITVIPWL
jgi:hypothetical protein